MTTFQAIAVGILALFFVLTFWGFAKVSEERVKILGLVASLAGVAIGYLLQEPRVQDSKDQVDEARAEVVEAQEVASAAIEVATDRDRRLTEIQRLLEPQEGGAMMIPQRRTDEANAILQERPEVSLELLRRVRSPN